MKSEQANRPYLVDATTLEPCPTYENRLCTITDRDHLHKFSHMVKTAEQQPTTDAMRERAEKFWTDFTSVGYYPFEMPSALSDFATQEVAAAVAERDAEIERLKAQVERYEKALNQQENG